MIDMGELGRLAWRDWTRDGVPSSGAHRPANPDVRTFVAAVDRQKGHVFASVAVLRLYQGDATMATLVSRATVGDGGGGPFAVKAGDFSSPDDGVLTIVDRLGRRWWRAVDSPFNLRWSVGGGDSADPVAAQVTRILAAANGNKVYVPAGSYHGNARIVRNASINLLGVGMGAGPGASTSIETSQFLINSSKDYALEIGDFIGSSFRDLKFGVEPRFRPMTAGGGVKLKAPGDRTVGSPLFERCAFISLWNGVEVEAPTYARFQQCYAEVWVNNAIRLVTKPGVEGSGGHVDGGHYFGDMTAGNTKGPAIYSEVGYLTVDGGACLLGGAQGIHFKPSNTPGGSLQVGFTHIEEQIQAGITCERGNAVASMIQVIGAEFSVIANGGPAFRAHFEIKADPAGSWVQDVLVSGTMARSRLAATSWFYDVQSGDNVVLTDLISEGLAGNKGGCIRVGPQVTSAAVIECKMYGAWPTLRYSLTAETLLIDTVNGLTAAEVKAITCRDGSRVWVADGLAGSNPLAGGGTGTYAERIGGVWVTAPSLRGVNTFSGSNTFKSPASRSNVTTWRNFTNGNELARIYDDNGNGLLSLYNASAIEKVRLFAAGQSFLAGSLAVENATPLPLGGAPGIGYLFSASAKFGIFFGLGAPTLSAAKGSLYLRADGSTTNDRMYVNTDGSTGWTPHITAT